MCVSDLHLSQTAFASGGPLGIHHMLPLDESGIWSRSNQLAVQNLSALTVVGGALWEGNDSRLGKTFWKATDAMLLTDTSAAVLKDVFRRARPSQGNDPNDWFGPWSHKSFPAARLRISLLSRRHSLPSTTLTIRQCGHWQRFPCTWVKPA
jgi:hypothetical protein